MLNPPPTDFLLPVAVAPEVDVMVSVTVAKEVAVAVAVAVTVANFVTVTFALVLPLPAGLAALVSCLQDWGAVGGAEPHSTLTEFCALLRDSPPSMQVMMYATASPRQMRPTTLMVRKLTVFMAAVACRTTRPITEKQDKSGARGVNG